MKTVPQPHGGAIKLAEKGDVLNPKGKPKGVPHSSTRLKRLLQLTENLTNPITHEIEGFSVAEQLDLAQIIKARKGDTQAYNTIMDRLEGKPQQNNTNLNVEVEQDESLPIEERLQNVLARIKSLQES